MLRSVAIVYDLVVDWSFVAGVVMAWVGMLVYCLGMEWRDRHQHRGFVEPPK